MLERSRKLVDRDFPKDVLSDLLDLNATTLDKEVFLLAYFCNTPVNVSYKLSTRKRIILFGQVHMTEVLIVC